MATPLAVSRLPSPGEVVAGKYRVERVLGRGGMGVVYAAHHLLLSQPVALKMMLPEVALGPEAVTRFVNEARAAARLESSHVARVLDVALEGGTPFLVLELLEGSDLAALSRASGPLPPATVVDWLMAAMEAVAEAHSVGIVHRDLKPSNLFLAKRKGGTTIKVLDFGISKVIAGHDEGGVSTASNAVLGSPFYMSPEQLRATKAVDGRTDVWSLGVIAYELLTGALPYEGANVVELFAAIHEHDPRPLRELRPELPQALEGAVLGCLRRVPSERWSSVRELAAALAPHGSVAARGSRDHIEMLHAAAGPALPASAAGPGIAPGALQVPTLPATAVAGGPGSTLATGPTVASPMVRTTGAVMTPRPPAAAPVRRSPWGLVVGAAGVGALVVAGALTLRPALPAPSSAATSPPVAPSTELRASDTTVPPAPVAPALPALSASTTRAGSTPPRAARPAAPGAPATSATPSSASAVVAPVRPSVPTEWN